MESDKHSLIETIKEDWEEIAANFKHTQNKRNSIPASLKTKETQEDQSTNKIVQNRLSKSQLCTRQPSITEPLSRKQSLALTRSSVSALTLRPKHKLHKSMLPLFYEPTYRLEPIASEKFDYEAVEVILKEELEKKLSNKTYDPEQVKTWVVELCSSVQKLVKELNYKRYKIVCFVLLVQNLGQGLHSASRCLWHESFDGRSTWIFSNRSIICDATVYGVYCE